MVKEHNLSDLTAPNTRAKDSRGRDGSDSEDEDAFSPRPLRRRASLETAPDIVHKKEITGYLSIGLLPKRRRSIDCTRGLGEFELTMLHDLRSYFDPTYRLNTIRERLRSISAEHGLSAKDMFDLVDVDGSGAVDADELGAMVAMLGVKVKQVDLVTLMELIDKSANGDCDVEEFKTWLEYRVDLSGRRKDPWDDYNDRKLLMRESLKFDPTLMKVMNSWWRLADADDSGSISKEEYMKLHINLQRALIKQKELDISKARALASQEWEFDSQGRKEMDQELFKLSFFQMADAWRTGDIKADAYTGFMDMLQTRMTTKDEDGNMCWAWEKDILWDVKLWEKPLKQKPGRLSIQNRALRDARKNKGDLKSRMNFGAISKEDLKALLPQEVIEATMRMEEMRSIQRDWMAGSGRKPMARSNPNARRTGLVMSFDLSAMTQDASSNSDTDSDSDRTPDGGPVTSVTVKKVPHHRLYETNDNKRDRGIKKAEAKMKRAADFQSRKTAAIINGVPFDPMNQPEKLDVFDEDDEGRRERIPEDKLPHGIEAWKPGFIRGTMPVPPHEISVIGTRTENHPLTLVDHVCWEELGYNFSTHPSGGLGEYSMSQPVHASVTRPQPGPDASDEVPDAEDTTPLDVTKPLLLGASWPSFGATSPLLYATGAIPSSPPKPRWASQYVSSRSPSASSTRHMRRAARSSAGCCSRSARRRWARSPSRPT